MACHRIEWWRDRQPWSSVSCHPAWISVAWTVLAVLPTSRGVKTFEEGKQPRRSEHRWFWGTGAGGVGGPCPRQIDPERSNSARLRASTCSKLITSIWCYS